MLGARSLSHLGELIDRLGCRGGRDRKRVAAALCERPLRFNGARYFRGERSRVYLAESTGGGRIIWGKSCAFVREPPAERRGRRARAHLRRRGEKARIEGIVRVGGFRVAESLVPAFERAKGNEFARTAVEERRGGEEDRVGAGTRTTGARETRGRGRLGSKYRKAERGVCRGERLRLEDRGEYQVAVDDPYATAARL